MATYWKLKKDAAEVVPLIYCNTRIAEDVRNKENISALKIQSWFRAEKVRAYMRYLHRCAIIIQRNYRAHVDRGKYRQLVQMKLMEMRQIYYNYMATKIQTLWRGFYVRKYIFNYYARKRYLDTLVKQNEIVRKDLESISARIKADQLKYEEDLRKHQKELDNRRHHYLISTIVRPGIYKSSLTKPQMSQRELELQKAKPLSTLERESLERERFFRSVESGVVDPLMNPFESTQMKSAPLPPIPASKPQGPFRDPKEVITQRYKPLEPSLRVATSYTSVEEARTKLKADEWTKRVIEEKFLPFTKRQEKYKSSLDSNTLYGRPEYGTKHFREIDERKKIIDKPFKRFVSPVPVFEKLGKTY